MKKKICVKKVLKTLLTVILIYTVVSMIGSAIIFKAIYPRHDSVNDFTLSYEDVDSSAYPCEELSFTSDGNSLSAHLYTCDSPSGLVVIAAGLGDGARSHLAEGMYFLGRGYDVFCYDATGVGESGGSGVVGLSQPGLDLRAALDYIAADEELSSLPILLYGHSAGGYGAATCLSDYPQVKAAAIISAFDTPVGLMYESAHDRVGFLADLQYPFMVMENARVFKLKANTSASDCLHDADIPVMVFEGSGDELIPYDLRLSSFRDKIDNPLVSYHIIDEEGRSGHSGMWLSNEAVQYRMNTSPDDGAADLIAANSLDSEYMSGIAEFYRAALAG